jgi:hypothetical protein
MIPLKNLLFHPPQDFHPHGTLAKPEWQHPNSIMKGRTYASIVVVPNPALDLI